MQFQAESAVVPGIESNINGTPVSPAQVETVNQQPLEQVQPQVQKPSHPAFLLELAHNLNFTRDDIESASTPELEKIVAIATRDRQRQNPLPQFIPQQQAPQEPQEPEFEWGFDPESKAPLTDEHFAPGIRNVKKIPHLEKKIAQLEQIIVGQGHAQQQQSRAQMLDSAFDNLGDDYTYLFGKGSVGRFQQDDPEVVLRNTAIQATGVPANHPEFPARLRKVADNIRSRMAPIQQTNGTTPANRIAPTEYKDWDQGTLAPTTQRNSPVAPKTWFQQVLEEVQAERKALGQNPSPAGDPSKWLV